MASGSGALTSEAGAAIGSPVGWVALCAANGAGLGTIWLMTGRPTLVPALAIVFLPALIGAAVGLRLGRPAVAVARA